MIGFIFETKLFIDILMSPFWFWYISHPFNDNLSSMITFLTLYRAEIAVEDQVISSIDPASRISSVTLASSKRIFPFLSLRIVGSDDLSFRTHIHQSFMILSPSLTVYQVPLSHAIITEVAIVCF